MVKVYGAILVSVSVWGTAFLAIKTALEELGPMELTALRFLPLVPVSLAFLFFRWPKETKAALIKHPWAVGAASFLLIPSYNWLLYAGQQKIPPNIAALIIGSSPLLTYLIAVAVKHENFSRAKLLGILTAFSGLCLAVSMGPRARFHGADLLGLLAIFGAAASAATYTIISHSLLRFYPPGLLMNLFIPLGSIPLLLTLPEHPVATVLGLGEPALISLLFLSLVATLVGFHTWFYALKRLPPSQVVVFVNLIPFLTMTIGYFFFNEPMNLYLFIGGALVVTGVYQTNRKIKNKEPKVHENPVNRDPS